MPFPWSNYKTGSRSHRLKPMHKSYMPAADLSGPVRQIRRKPAVMAAEPQKTKRIEEVEMKTGKVLQTYKTVSKAAEANFMSQPGMSYRILKGIVVDGKMWRWHEG